MVALFGSSFAEDYCQLCSDHVGCDNPGTPADICDQIIDIDDELKNIFVDTHNQLRNTVAGGDIEHLEPAVRMPTVVSEYYLRLISRTGILIWGCFPAMG